MITNPLEYYFRFTLGQYKFKANILKINFIEDIEIENYEKAIHYNKFNIFDNKQLIRNNYVDNSK